MRLGLVQQAQLLGCVAFQHLHRAGGQRGAFVPVPAACVPRHLEIRGGALPAALLAVTVVAGCLPAGAAEGDGVLRVLNDAVQLLAHGQLQALVRASAASGAGQLLVGDDVTFFKAVSVATERLGVQQSSSGDAWIQHRQRKKE